MEVTQPARISIEDLAANPLFSCSLTPMLLIDGERRCVDANPSACLLLRQPIEAVRALTIDDLTAPEQRARLHAAWSLLLQGQPRLEGLVREMRMPDGTSLAVDVSVTAQIRPGRYVAIINFFAAQAPDRRPSSVAAPARAVLTKREREVLTLVALGNTGAQIAGQLFLSPTTVQTHVVNALIKLEAKNRAHGVALALQTNELDIAALL